MNGRNFIKALLVVPAAVKAVVTNPPAPTLIGCDVSKGPDKACLMIVSSNPDGPGWFYQAWVEAQHEEVFRMMHIPADVFSK
jgi:hypothetical protein